MHQIMKLKLCLKSLNQPSKTPSKRFYMFLKWFQRMNFESLWLVNCVVFVTLIVNSGVNNPHTLRFCCFSDLPCDILIRQTFALEDFEKVSAGFCLIHIENLAPSPPLPLSSGPYHCVRVIRCMTSNQYKGGLQFVLSKGNQKKI